MFAYTMIKCTLDLWRWHFNEEDVARVTGEREQSLSVTTQVGGSTVQVGRDASPGIQHVHVFRVSRRHQGGIIEDGVYTLVRRVANVLKQVSSHINHLQYN